MKPRRIWAVLAAIWVAWCVAACLVALVALDWRALFAILAILGFTMPNYARLRRKAKAPIVE